MTDIAHYRAALDRLPPLDRAVFLLNAMDDLDYREIAFRLGIGTDEVTRRIARALVEIVEVLYPEPW